VVRGSGSNKQKQLEVEVEYRRVEDKTKTGERGGGELKQENRDLHICT
jgi:hypothetical protein